MTHKEVEASEYSYIIVARHLRDHTGYLCLVLILIVFVAVNCLDYLCNWPMITPLEQLLYSSDKV
jgi:hypothetical protein